MTNDPAIVNPPTGAANDLALLACYAHPDDEQGVSGVMRKCLDEGIRVGLVCATRGEVGEIADPSLATPETLGEVREGELRRAAAVLGVQDVFFLDYRDSGMVGTPPNQDPRAFINADEYEAVGKLVRIIRAFRPTILITFDRTGGYGHPDHLAIHRWTTTAFSAAGDPTLYPEAGPAFAPRRLFYGSFGRSSIAKMRDFLIENNIESAFLRIDPASLGMPDEEITHRIDVSPYVALKRESLAEHRTQTPPNSIFKLVPESLWHEWRKTESFAFVTGDPPPAGETGDLFAGLR